MPLNHEAAERKAQELLREWLDGSLKAVKHPRSGNGPDLIVDMAAGAKLLVEVKATVASHTVAGAIQQVQLYAERVRGRVVPVVAVPFMTDFGKSLCAAAGVSWFDLSGNADIRAPGIRIYVEGKTNKFKRRGRPSTVFAPRSSRIVRVLLMSPTTPIAQRDLAEVAEVDDGFTSRVVAKLVEDNFIERAGDGRLLVRDPGLLLDAWREAYAFEKHTIAKGHITARSGNEALHHVSDALRASKVQHATTGLSAAWLLTKFAGFRLATFFLSKEPGEKLVNRIGFRTDDRGANIWLVVPNDDAVFVGAKDAEGIRCVHPLQAYIDLKAQPERATEAAAELRKRHLTWKS